MHSVSEYCNQRQPHLDGACGTCQGTSVSVYDHTQMSIAKVFFGTTNIQKMRRVALDSHLLATLSLREGGVAQAELDVENAAIVVRKAGDGRSEFPGPTTRRRRA
jgi:hypothetical protein